MSILRGNSIKPAPEWDAEMIEKLANYIECWRLDRRETYCIHQKESGMADASTKVVMLNSYILKDSVRDKPRYHDLRKRHANAILSGMSDLTEDELRVLTLPEYLETGYELADELKPFYFEDHKYGKPIGKLTKYEHPEGMLYEPCPVCGHKFGLDKFGDEISADLRNWFYSLPEAKHCTYFED